MGARLCGFHLIIIYSYLYIVFMASMSEIRKRYRRFFKKRGKKAPRVARTSRRVTLSKTPNAFPPRMDCNLVYYSGQVGTTTSTSMGFYQFRANSLFDPDLTGGGHQARYRDQMAAIYLWYRVKAITIKVECYGLTNNACSVVGIVPVAFNATPLFTQSNIHERRYKRVTIGGSQEPKVFQQTIPINAIEMMSRSEFEHEDDFKAQFGANPLRVPTINVCWQNIDEATSTGHNIVATITYHTHVWGLRQVASS